MVNSRENFSVISLRRRKQLEEAQKDPINNKETKDELIQEEIRKYNNMVAKKPLNVQSKFLISTYKSTLSFPNRLVK